MAWEEDQKLVLYRLDELKTVLALLSAKMDAMDKRIDAMDLSFTEWKAKVSVWGVIGGFVAGLATQLGFWFLNKFFGTK